MVPQQVHLLGQWLGKIPHGCPTWWLFVYLLRCLSVCFLLYKSENSWAEEYFKYIPGRIVLSYIENLFIPGTLERAGFWNVWVCSFRPNSKSVLARLGMALHVPFPPLTSSDWKTSTPSLLLLKGEVTSHVSLSESSLKLRHLRPNHSKFHLFYQLR